MKNGIVGGSRTNGKQSTRLFWDRPFYFTTSISESIHDLSNRVFGAPNQLDGKTLQAPPPRGILVELTVLDERRSALPQ